MLAGLAALLMPLGWGGQPALCLAGYGPIRRPGSVEIKGSVDGVGQRRFLGGQKVADLRPSAAFGTVTMLSQLITLA